MKFLHITFHKGCELEIEYVFTMLGHTVESMRFDDGETCNNDIYQVNEERAQKCWNRYKEYFDTFDGIITSDTCPTSRPFLQNHWNKLLIIWICNRFDYGVEGDEGFYNLIRNIPNRKNVYLISNTAFECIYAKHRRNVEMETNIIRPLGKNILSSALYKIHQSDEERFFIPLYENETKFMNLFEKMDELGIKHNNGERFKDHVDLLQYKGIICLPYAWSTITYFEMMQLGMIYFIPSKRFIIELLNTQFPNRQTYWFQEAGFVTPEYLSYAEWYCDEHKDLIIYFDSWSDLKYKIKTTDYENQTKKIREYAMFHHTNIVSKWKNIIEQFRLRV